MCFGSRDKNDDTGVARSRELDKMIRADEKRLSKEVKLLLLGTDRCFGWRHGHTS
jgi:guanine nucleotide-binding protein subunit alpha